MLYTNQEPSEFFYKSEYEFLKHEFDFEALSKITSEKFVKELSDSIITCYIRKFYNDFDHEKGSGFLYFYVKGHNSFSFVKAYYSNSEKLGEYFTIDNIPDYFFDYMDLNIKITNKGKEKIETE